MNNIKIGDLLTYDRKDDHLVYGERYEVMEIYKDLDGCVYNVKVMTKWNFGAWYNPNNFKTLCVSRTLVINDILK